MKKLNVLLVCGSGASSGFMAANMRKAALRQHIEIDIKARSESEIENYIDDIDALMVGPHLAYILDEVDEYTHGSEVKVILMKAEYYATLNGEAAIQHLLDEMSK
ncbi:PTS sugar transporter subunit IIB [[Clostridium] innocuum]|nr:PTS sugar transporter subunit IIB [[Clostridium] innocuum]MCR0576930.1 PTS sugar transporter subunit IIB [[Clostridium] innocuum]